MVVKYINFIKVAQSNTECLKVGGAMCHINYEDSTNHNVRVLVIDSGVPSQNAVFNMTIRVLDVNDKPGNVQLSGEESAI